MSGPTVTRWERAYQAFETPAEERRKFIARFKRIGADAWPRDWRILEVCSGRGSGVHAWREMGFRCVIGVDYSAALALSQEPGGLQILGDVRYLPVRSASIDVVVVQGGLHHLHSRQDVDLTLAEMCRVASERGTVVIIEPWLTPFLQMVHAACRRSFLRNRSPKIEALATMIEEERETYERWLDAPEEYFAIINRPVVPRIAKKRWGKLVIVGSPARS